LKTTINPDAPSLTKDGGYIADGVNKELDELRDLRKNSSKVLDEFTERQRKITGVPSLRVGFNRIFGYYIEITKAKKPETLPSDYIRKQTVVNGERYINDELLRLEKEIMSASERSLVLEDEIFTELKKYLFDRIKYFKTDADIIADTDCICSLADVAETNNYVKPKMTEKGAIEITEGRHPVVEALLKANEFVPNDTVIDNDNPVSILTGPNMAGKSTYIRQVAVIVLLAHIGSFVPASKAEICVVDRIFTRVGASDNLVRGQSTFMVEMLEVANILNNATPKSLLILDEIGRGTSTLDGLSIAWAIVEHIFLKIKAKTLFATHYHELGELEGTFPGIKNYRVLVQENPSGIVFLYKIARGSASRSFGIEAAAIAGVKSSVIKRAKDILKNLSETHELSGDLKEKMSSRVTESSVACEQMTLFPEDEKFTKIKNMLNGTDLNRCTPLEALTILADMKKILE
jgi:DNA mismatch repair protein MutS